VVVVGDGVDGPCTCTSARMCRDRRRHSPFYL